ncbi:type IV pilin-like G/H family protein [Scytonema millei]|uniref:Prepilin-type N-terminal cleavage/methylation domain-containing protein n=1 Tax=Scytonema millei VB511283 TaxID=1245923 RepID=A0A9X5I4C1_9CYAN|nr:type IV pilin-like G/H family protein [Scytonema millei]NHC34800.1 prepilin-type N-terminal cleavage/methylation domain-containing protein [Scytonema millei VB511283]
MKSELKAKLLQNLLKNKKQNAGFTLIELLVVVIIIGILSSIALPSFLSQSAKARASEAKTNLGAMNRAQQTYYLENQAFVEDTVAGDGSAIAALGIGIKDSNNFAYRVTATTVTTDVINRARSKNKDLKGHVGGVFSTGGQTPTVLCEANTAAEEAVAGADTAADPALAGAVPTCDAATSKQVGG